jgi:DNA topoisomerase VI subunit A
MSSAAKSDRKKASAASKNGRANAQTMAASQREISVSEFFSRNRHLLGFDNPRRALLLKKAGYRAEQQAFAVHNLNHMMSEYLPDKLENTKAFLP